MDIVGRACAVLMLMAGLVAAGTAAAASKSATAAQSCERTIDADLVALDQPIFLNRLGASMQGGMIFALRRDIVPITGSALTKGNVQLTADRRPRPLVLRARVGDCLHIIFQNLLSDEPLGQDGKPQPCGPDAKLYPEQTCTRQAGVHIYGMDEESAADGALGDGSFVGANRPSIVPPGGSFEYTVRAGAEGVFLLYSAADNANTASSGGGFGGQLAAGLFGSLVVEPRTSEWYRSQVSKVDLDRATLNAAHLPPRFEFRTVTNGRYGMLDHVKNKIFVVTQDPDGTVRTLGGQPYIYYDATRPLGDGTCVPVLRMVDVGYHENEKHICVPTDTKLRTYYGDLTAAITGPEAGSFPATDTAPPFNPNGVEPNRHEPYREFVEHYHDILTMSDAQQAFPAQHENYAVLGNGGEAFAINYGADGIGSEILANRLGTGPEGGCVDCRFEEFFLSSWAVGDPAELVGRPDGLTSNAAIRPVPYTPQTVLTDDSVKYPDDPSNVYHSYIGDRVVFRIVHAGQLVTHLHHLHAHQWLHSRNNDESTYLDSQLITPGSTYTQEIDYDGSGNRNRTVGDSIFHCHFYPHFAAGMWGLWRSHDVFEAGTDLTKDPSRDFVRALPDGELRKGAPIPAIVPLPTIAMAPMPARTKICPVDRNWNGEQILGAGNACPPADQSLLSGEAAFVVGADLDNHLNPGYPFFVPGIAGQRAPHPPKGYAPDQGSVENGQTTTLDGGLARHVALAGRVSNDHANAWDFSKDLDRLTALKLDEDGTKVEKAAMQFHNDCRHASYRPDGSTADFLLNGGPSVAGAPFANPSWGTKGTTPCTDLADPPPPQNDPGKPDRVYKAADIQMDVVFNKLGWHYPQERFETLWEDVPPTVARERAPEPLFFRANSGETIEFWQTDLVPAYYELDDFQVRTPTDVIGQHIHLVKFDVTASDGAANGYNYEAGSLSPDAVREAIIAIRAQNNCAETAAISFACPKPKAPPADLGPAPPGQNWLGAQTTVERWWADPVTDLHGKDRTLRTVFTHDHFGPSTHQQIGLYAGLLVEPKGSSWKIPAVPNPGTGQVRTDVPMGTRHDGGPTSWAADIITANVPSNLNNQSYREFALEFQDIALAYVAGSRSSPGPYPCPNPSDKAGTGGSGDTAYDCVNGGTQPSPTTNKWGWLDQTNAVNPPIVNPNSNPPPSPPLPPVIAAQPSLITVGNGLANLNYRNEPLPARVQPTAPGAAHDVGSDKEDLSLAWASIPRNDPNLNLQPAGQRTLQPPEPAQPVNFPGGFIGAQDLDPYTPLLRAYPNDPVQVRVLVGAHEFPHTFTIHGMKWLFEPSAENSGHVSAQPMGISEHFEMLFNMPPAGTGASSDYLYEPDANNSGQEQGLWGILRAYNALRPDLPPLPNNQRPPFAAAKQCPDNPHIVSYSVSAVTAAKALPDHTLTYNSRSQGGYGPITQPGAILFVRSEDLDKDGRLLDGKPIEPLILRANAGDCVKVSLTNRLDPNQVDVNKRSIFDAAVPDRFNVTRDLNNPDKQLSYPLYPSARVGLHAQLVSEDVTASDGTRVGLNPDQTVSHDQTIEYTWYAGARDIRSDGRIEFTPMELGTINLLPADPIEQPVYAAAGALVVEPAGSTWFEDAGTRAAATVFEGATFKFREFVAVWQSQTKGTGFINADATARSAVRAPVQVATNGGINYRTEPVSFRLPATATDLSTFYSNTALAPPGTVQPDPRVVAWDPQTPIFAASAGMPVRFRFSNPSGQQLLTEIFGQHWQEEPWNDKSVAIADNPLSETMGAMFLGPAHSLNLVVDKAGGSFEAPGDYLYRNFVADATLNPFPYSMWGLFRVGGPARDTVVVKTYDRAAGGAVVAGYVTRTSPAAPNAYAQTVQLTGPGAQTVDAQVNQTDGRFTATLPGAPAVLTLRSANGGSAVAALPPPAPPVVAAQAPEAAAAPSLKALASRALGDKAARFINRSGVTDAGNQ